MSQLQWKASHPDYSVWVSASAGTGKTKILTDRVLRLLLKNADPQKILCLTFTNAAASEMRQRIDGRLSKWATANKKDLEHELQLLLSSKPHEKDLQNAKELLSRSLKPYGKIEIHTIHSYCQKVLKRFPLEANISPGFQIIDDIKAKEILNKVRNQLYLDDTHNEIMDFFTANFHEITINDILDEIINQKLKFKNYPPESDKNKADIAQEIMFFDKSNELEEIKKLCNELKRMFGTLQDSNNEVDEPHKIINLNVDDEAQVLSLFLTKDGSKKQRILTKKLADKNPALLQKSQICQDKVYQYDQNLKNHSMIKYSELLKSLAEIFIKKYEEYKTANGFLDYDDLIYYTKNLFNLSHVRDWVLYKLDGGIDHLLVDEAQDTSPYQWEIIEAMITEFYAGESARDSERTIFVVGDEKQSIFSFQGANLDSLNLISRKLQYKLLAAKKNYENINLEYSYRSVPAIIEVVYNIFDYIKRSLPDFFSADNPKILPFRENHPGKVELWPLVEAMKTEGPFWPKPEDHDTTSVPQKQLAIIIADYIKCEIDKGEILPSTGLAVRAQDFMILVRKRDILATEIINELKNQSLQTAGIDRMLLSENLSVMDLISVAKFVVSPQDNLNLAVLLKSPLVGLNDSILSEIIALKKSASIWETLKNLDDTIVAIDSNFIMDKLQLFLKLYNICDCSNFFHLIADTFGYREILTRSNGADSNDAINEFLYLSHNYAFNINNSIQSFIYWFETNEIEIKRNVHSTDKIKIMTVHASKGLQAPIVILCDTVSLPVNKSKFYHNENGKLLAVQKSSMAPQGFNDYKDQQHLKDLQEYMRLLYVGMTRPQDHLIICGYQPGEKLSPYCWYNLVANSMHEIGQVGNENISRYESNIINQNTEYNLQNSFKLGKVTENKVENGAGLTNDFVRNDAVSDQSLINKLLPPLPSVASMTLSPLVDWDFLEYGKVFHKILEDSIKAKNLANLKSHPLINTLNLMQQDKIRKSIEVLLEKGELQSLIAGVVKTEINLGIFAEGETKLGRIDLLCIKDDEVTIIDYKSDARPPKLQMEIPLAYIDQLNFYSKSMQKIYPDLKITPMILWLSTGKFMQITQN